MEIGGAGEEPLVDKVAQGVVGDQGRIAEPLHRDRASEVAVGEPPLDARPVVGLASAQSDWIGEQIKAYRTPEQMRDAHLRLFSLIQGKPKQAW